MTKMKIRKSAQNAVLGSALNVLYNESLSEEELIECGKQIARIEKMFGYEPNSWSA